MAFVSTFCFLIIEIMTKHCFQYLFCAMFIVFLLLTNKSIGQTYTFSPGKTNTINVDTSQNNFGGIDVQNIGSQNLNLTWRWLSTDTLIDSYFQLCNSGICFLNLPNSGVMPTITPGGIGWIKFHMFSGRTNGVNTIKYVLKNASIQADTLTFIINVIGGITGIKELKNGKDKAIVYPNPSSSETTIQLNLHESSDVILTSLNPLGQCIYKETANYNAGLNSIKIDTEQYPSGIYTLIISTINGVITKKLTVTK